MLTGFTFCIPLKNKCAEDLIKAYSDHICCTFGPSRKILTDNGTKFKNKLWKEVFEKLKTEQKFTPIYSPQCNGRIEGFHKFLKATIVKQLELELNGTTWYGRQQQHTTFSLQNHQESHHFSSCSDAKQQ